jgi:cytochrome c peroxidase
MNFSKLFFLTLIIIFSFSCKKKGEIAPIESSEELHYVNIERPNNFPEMILNSENPLSEEGIELGRKLYYDTKLSNNGKSCSSCHFQSNSFSLASVNSLAHVNLAWHSSFLWNGAVKGTLEDAMMFEVEDFFNTTVANIQNDANYPQLFLKVFGTSNITTKNIAFALAQFIRSMVSSNSKFDKYLRGELILSSEEFSGMDIFLTERGDCFHCHSVGLFTDNNFHNTGLDDVFTNTNWGRFEVTNNEADKGKFKSPTLRNVELTAPYMHDARFSTLEQVVEFYNSGVKVTQYTDPIMTKTGKEFGLQLSAQEKSDLVSFLKTLTDTTFVNNPKFSHP